MKKFFNARKQEQNKLKLISISNGTGATKNLSIYEYGDDIIAVDYGIGFPEGDDYGIDYLIPDMTYLVENAQKVRGLVISHAHADHFGAVPHLLRKLNIPVYANKLTLGSINKMLSEKDFKDIKDTVSLNEFGPDFGVLELGVFKVSSFLVNHSVPGSLGIIIDTPEGRILHMADFKIDETPVLDPPFDLEKLRDNSKDGVLCLLSDCLGSRQRGGVPSEATLNDTFPKVFKKYQTEQLFITTISSNISRMKQIMDAAIDSGRRIVTVGRSIDQAVSLARELGYLQYADEHFVDIKDASELAQDSIFYLIAGCFGQPGSALSRLSLGEHHDILLDEGAVVVYSAEPNPPGVDVDVDRVNSDLILRGAEVIDHFSMEHLHVSGHGHRDELSTVAKIVNPKYFVPIGGNPQHIHEYKRMIGDIGLNSDNVFELMEGGVIEFSGGNATLGEPIETLELMVDGTLVSPIVVKDRELLSTDGVFIVIVPASKDSKQLLGKVDIVTRGFVYVKESRLLLGKTRDLVNKIVEKKGNRLEDWGSIKHKIEKRVQKYLYKETGRKPIIIVHSIFI